MFVLIDKYLKKERKKITKILLIMPLLFMYVILASVHVWKSIVCSEVKQNDESEHKPESEDNMLWIILKHVKYAYLKML